MGLLTQGTPLSWEDTKKWADHVRKHGIKQFLAQYKKLMSRKKDVLYWGDEIEYTLIKFDHTNRKVYVALKAQDILTRLRENSEQNSNTSESTSWLPEYASYQVEGTPGKPYGSLMAHFNTVEANMSQRRKEIQDQLEEDEAPLSLTVFPRLGCGTFTWPIAKTNPVNGISRSLFFPDEAINQGHVRFMTVTRNCRLRRTEKQLINIPIYKDINTKSPFIEDFSILGDDGSSAAAAKPDHIYMDCMGFGMGNCCLQVTFQASCLDEAKALYDQLAVMCPIMLALSASSPVYRGYLSDNDTRWPAMAGACDDRTKEERGVEPLKENQYRIAKSRYDSIDSFISTLGQKYNDIHLTFNQEIFEELIAEGVDDLLARHIAHLFIRDPVSVFAQNLDQDDENDTNHFENIQSTNWQTMRFKPPPPNSNIGWRVEFRPMEAQLTDFESAAFSVFILLLTRVILSYQLNFLIPISKVDENMKTAFKRDAVISDKFYFRKNILTEYCKNTLNGFGITDTDPNQEYELMTINEIFHGKEDFPGLLPLIDSYIDSIDIDVDTKCTVTQYVRLISLRASGHLQTTAKWIRNFVLNHPEYKQDSVVSDSINYDLLCRITQISRGELYDPNHLFPHMSKSSKMIPEAVRHAEALLDQKFSCGQCR